MDADLRPAYENRPVCVTGGAGFIGSHLVTELVQLGAEVTVIDDLSTGVAENLDHVKDRVRFVGASILDPAAMMNATGGAELVFHQAALTSVPGSVEQPQRYHEVNATGTLRVLEAARLRGASGQTGDVRVINAASSSAYGNRQEDPLTENLTPEPLSPYAAAKCAAEFMVRAYAVCYGISAVSLRYFNIFGPRQRPDSPYAAVVPRFAEAMLRGERPVVFGDGTQTRDFTHVSNAVRANLLAGTCTGPLHGEVVNIACGRSYSVLELIEKMASMLGVEPAWDAAPPRVGEVLHSRADISAARALLGYEPVMSIDEGLTDALDYYRSLDAPT